MRQNDLEQFIQENRTEFDAESPRSDVWAAIRQDLDKPAVVVRPMRVQRPWYQVAAAVALLLMTGGAGGMWLAQQNDPAAMAQERVEERLPEFAEAEAFYNQQIGERNAELTKYHPDTQVTADLKALDQSLAELKAELANVPAGREEEIVQRMIANYRLKLQLLERVLERMEQFDHNSDDSSSHKNNRHEIGI